MAVETSESSEAPAVDLQKVILQNTLSADEKDKVNKLLLGNAEVFGGDNDIGCLETTPHKIELTDYTPIYQRPRRFPGPVNMDIEKQIKELELLDIIEPSESGWSSPVVPIRKKDGSIRLCIDYRRLNAVTKADKYPLPNLSDAIFGLHGVKYFTSLDLVKGYYQVPLDVNT